MQSRLNAAAARWAEKHPRFALSFALVSLVAIAIFCGARILILFGESTDTLAIGAGAASALLGLGFWRETALRRRFRVSRGRARLTGLFFIFLVLVATATFPARGGDGFLWPEVVQLFADAFNLVLIVGSFPLMYAGMKLRRHHPEQAEEMASRSFDVMQGRATED